MSRLLGAFALICLCVATRVHADERILSFDSEITVQPDGTASITCLVRTVREPAGIRVKPIADARPWQMKAANTGNGWRITEAAPVR